MSNTLLEMPNPKSKSAKSSAKRPPSREKLTYTAIPKEYGEILKRMGAEGKKYEGRSVAYLTKIAVRAFLQAEGELDAKGKAGS